MIYFDSAATSLLKPETVYRAVYKAMKTMASPGRGAYAPAMIAAEELYSCRAAAAELFNAEGAQNVVFTSNATEALNIAIKSLAEKGSKVIISGFEHNSVLRPLSALGADICVAGRKLFDPEAVLRDFERNIKGKELAVCTHVSNVFGFILPIYEIAELCRENSVPLIVDASQSAGILDVDMKKLGAEFIAMPGHKGLMGPQGTGILLCAGSGRPLKEGGSGSDSASLYMPDYLPDRLEAGTHNVCGIAGLRAGIEFIKKTGRENIFKHETGLMNYAAQKLQKSGYELFLGDNCSQLGVLSLRKKGISPDEIAQRLYKKGICVRSGLHCAPLAHKSAGTIEGGTVRLSFSPFNSFTELKRSIEIFRAIL